MSFRLWPAREELHQKREDRHPLAGRHGKDRGGVYDRHRGRGANSMAHVAPPRSVRIGDQPEAMWSSGALLAVVVAVLAALVQWVGR